ncbi:MAG: RNA-binding domain-containing protein [Anaerolineales bacterium]
MSRKSRRKQPKKNWYKIDLHLHTPASQDYQEENVSYLDILRQAEIRGLDIIALTDHNTVRGYSTMLDEIDKLSYLEKLERAEPDENRRLQEYRRLLDKILVLPGFEFTATFGFHVLGIFPPETSVRELEHILLSLHIPPDALEHGSSIVGASSDVLTAYHLIREAGGLVIPAHVNSAHGVFMKGMDFGGQTRIAYTQDANIHALEVTDLEKRGRHTTARFFDGTKPGYPRRMRCIQNSDAHRLSAEGKQKNKNLGVGDRITEVLMPERSFDALRQVFESNDFALTRPYRSSRDPFDHVQAAREEGESIVQTFHESLARKGGHLHSIIADVCAFANTNGGTVYIGISANPKDEPVGVTRASTAIETLYGEIDKRISPKLEVDIDAQSTRGKTVVRIQVPHGDNIPYAIDDNKIYLRDESDTNLAVRDEIVSLVQGNKPHVSTPAPQKQSEVLETHAQDAPSVSGEVEANAEQNRNDSSPMTGVEVVGTEKRRGTLYHMMRDLRNDNIIHNVTRSSARRLWHYAITQTEDHTLDEKKVDWHGDYGLVRKYRKAGAMRYDLCQRVTDSSGKPHLRVYYGVTEDGMIGPWASFIEEETPV